MEKTETHESGIELKRILAMAWQGFTRHGFMSAAATTVMALALFSILSVLIMRGIAQTAIAEINKRLDVVVDILDEAPLPEVYSMIKMLESRPDVVLVDYVSRDEALELITDTDTGDVRAFFDTYEIENPLSAKLHITTREPAQHEAILALLKSDYATLVSVDRTESDSTYRARIQKLIDITHGIRLGSYFITALFICIAFLIVFNTLRITIHNRATEIEIMQLVGAGRAFIHGPLIAESVLYGIFGTLMSTVVFVIIMVSTGPTISHYLGSTNITTLDLRKLVIVILVQVVVSAVIGPASALVAISRYVRGSLSTAI